MPSYLPVFSIANFGAPVPAPLDFSDYVGENGLVWAEFVSEGEDLSPSYSFSESLEEYYERFYNPASFGQEYPDSYINAINAISPYRMGDVLIYDSYIILTGSPDASFEAQARNYILENINPGYQSGQILISRALWQSWLEIGEEKFRLILEYQDYELGYERRNYLILESDILCSLRIGGREIASGQDCPTIHLDPFWDLIPEIISDIEAFISEAESAL